MYASLLDSYGFFTWNRTLVRGKSTSSSISMYSLSLVPYGFWMPQDIRCIFPLLPESFPGWGEWRRQWKWFSFVAFLKDKWSSKIRSIRSFRMIDDNGLSKSKKETSLFHEFSALICARKAPSCMKMDGRWYPFYFIAKQSI